MDRHIRRHAQLIKALRCHTVILQVLCTTQQCIGHVTVRVAHDGLIDLHLVSCGNQVVVRLEDGLVDIVIGTADRTICIDGTGLEDDIVVAVSHFEIKPHTT